MKTTILAHLLIAGSAIGLAWPMLSDEGEQAALASDAPTAKQQSANQQSGLQAQAMPQVTWAQHVALPRAIDGHFYADVYINGSSSRMLVDTGATTIALTGEDASAMGVYWDYSALGVVAQGANGPVEGVHVRLPQVELGGFVAQNVSAIVVPEGLSVSLLGQSFLSTVDKVEIADGQMVLSN